MSQFSHRFYMLWQPNLHNGELLQPFPPAYVALPLTLTALPQLLCISLLHNPFLPPTPPCSPAGQFSGVKHLTCLQQLPSLAPRQAGSALRFALVTWPQPGLSLNDHGGILWDTPLSPCRGL